ncbi:MAG: hypothetical protein LBQ22_01945 [Bacteroidales bacterium]|nr:hypothetical protein [Bacteroidales bacterium]
MKTKKIIKVIAYILLTPFFIIGILICKTSMITYSIGELLMLNIKQAKTSFKRTFTNKKFL